VEVLTETNIVNDKIDTIVNRYPFAETFLNNNGIEYNKFRNLSLNEYFAELGSEYMEDHAIDSEKIINQFIDYIQQMKSFLGEDNKIVDSLVYFQVMINPVERKISQNL